MNGKCSSVERVLHIYAYVFLSLTGLVVFSPSSPSLASPYDRWLSTNVVLPSSFKTFMIYIFASILGHPPTHHALPRSPKFTLLHRSLIKILLFAVSIRYLIPVYYHHQSTACSPSFKNLRPTSHSFWHNFKAIPLGLIRIPYVLIFLFLHCFFVKVKYVFYFGLPIYHPPWPWLLPVATLEISLYSLITFFRLYSMIYAVVLPPTSENC